MKKFVKRVMSLALTAVMCVGMAVSASAATPQTAAGNYTVQFLKHGKTDVSMSDRAVANRTAVVEVDENGTAVITIMLKPIKNYIGADGWIESVMIGTDKQNLTGEGGERGYISNNPTVEFHFYETATLTLKVDTLNVVNGEAIISGVKPHTELVLTGTKIHNPLPSSMVDSLFDVKLVKQP